MSLTIDVDYAISIAGGINVISLHHLDGIGEESHNNKATKLEILIEMIRVKGLRELIMGGKEVEKLDAFSLSALVSQEQNLVSHVESHFLRISLFSIGNNIEPDRV